MRYHYFIRNDKLKFVEIYLEPKMMELITNKGMWSIFYITERI